MHFNCRPQTQVKLLGLLFVAVAHPVAGQDTRPRAASASEIAGWVEVVDAEQCAWPETRGLGLIYVHVRDGREVIILHYRPEDGYMEDIRFVHHRYAGGNETYRHGLEGHAPLGPGPEIISSYTYSGSDFIVRSPLTEEQVVALKDLAHKIVAGCPEP